MPRTTKSIYVLVTFVFLNGLQILNAQFNESIGEIVEIQGKVEISFKDGDWQKAKINTAIKPGNKLRTGEYSSAVIKGPSGQLHEIGEMTTIHFGNRLQSNKSSSLLLARFIPATEK